MPLCLAVGLLNFHWMSAFGEFDFSGRNLGFWLVVFWVAQAGYEYVKWQEDLRGEPG